LFPWFSVVVLQVGAVRGFGPLAVQFFVGGLCFYTVLTYGGNFAHLSILVLIVHGIYTIYKENNLFWPFWTDFFSFSNYP